MSLPKPLMTDASGAVTSLHVVSEEESSPYPKCSLVLRGLARTVDVALAWGCFLFAGRAGSVLALLFILLADGMFQGQSPGKRIFGVKAIYLPTRAGARFRESVLRNAPFGLIVILGMMPRPLGSVAFWSGAIFIGAVEAWKVLRDPLGIRLGDVWAVTQVIDGKVVSGSSVAATSEQAARAPGRPMSLIGGQERYKGEKCGSR